MTARDPRGVVRVPVAGRCSTSGKNRYKNEKLARQALALSQRYSLATVHVQSVYKCPHCRDWHLTSRPRAPKNPTRHDETEPNDA